MMIRTHRVVPQGADDRNTIGIVSRIIASESSRQPSTKYIAMMTSKIPVLPSGNPVIQPLTRLGIEARIRKLLTGSPDQDREDHRRRLDRVEQRTAEHFSVKLPFRMPSANAPTAPMLAASVGEKTPR